MLLLVGILSRVELSNSFFAMHYLLLLHSIKLMLDACQK